MEEPTNQQTQPQKEKESLSSTNEIKEQQKQQLLPKQSIDGVETNPNNQQIKEEKTQSVSENQNAKVEVAESKKQAQPVKQTRQNIPAKQTKEADKNTIMNGITQKEFRMMTKKVMQYDVLKESYQKMGKSQENLRKENNQLKNTIEKVQNSNAQLNKSLQNLQRQASIAKQQIIQLKLQIQKRKKQNESYQKRLEQSKKKIEQAQGMGQKVKQLSMIIDMTTKQVEQHKRNVQKQKGQIQKYKQLLKCQKELFNSAKVQLDKLRQSQKQTFTMKQQLVRISTEYKNLKAEKQQLPIMIDKFEHQQQMISQLKESIQQYEKKVQESKNINQKLEKKINQLIDEKKEIEKKYSKVRCELQQSIGENDALKAQLQQQRAEFQVQKRRYLAQIKTLKVQLHNQHEKLKITQWQLSESKKKQKASVKLQRVNVMNLSKEDLLNILEQMEMKNQSLKLNLDHIAQVIHEKDKKIKDQEASIMILARELTKSYPNLHQSQGMEYVQKDIIQIGKSKKSDWGQIVEKVMIENLRLKYSVTALGQQYNQQIRTKKQK